MQNLYEEPILLTDYLLFNAVLTAVIKISKGGGLLDFVPSLTKVIEGKKIGCKKEVS